MVTYSLQEITMGSLSRNTGAIREVRSVSMAKISEIHEPQSLYELSWTYAPGGMFAFNAKTG